jgi:hypothetical protein
MAFIYLACKSRIPQSTPTAKECKSWAREIVVKALAIGVMMAIGQPNSPGSTSPITPEIGVPVSLMNQPLVSVLPHGQLDFEEIYVPGPERGHQTSISPTQD